MLADGREVHYQMEPILGAFTLEGFGLGVDPVNRRLIRVPGLLKILRYA